MAADGGDEEAARRIPHNGGGRVTDLTGAKLVKVDGTRAKFVSSRLNGASAPASSLGCPAAGDVETITYG